jgi:hypothetical protein
LRCSRKIAIGAETDFDYAIPIGSQRFKKIPFVLLTLARNQINIRVRKVRPRALTENSAKVELCQMLTCDKVPEVRRSIYELAAMALHLNYLPF